MATSFFNRRARQTLILSGISVGLIVFLVRAVEWEDALRIFQTGNSPHALWYFSAMAIAIAWVYGYRWRLLLDQRLSQAESLVSATLCLGGNMFLPARGGDLVRVHYSHGVSGMQHAEVLSRLFVEKIIDLLTIAAVGVIAACLLKETGASSHFSLLLMFTGSALLIAVLAMTMVKFFAERLLLCLRPFFKAIRQQSFFEHHVRKMVLDARHALKWSTMLLPGSLTLGMWLSVYACSYIFAAQFVGVTLSYQESLLVLFAGALGLMLPAAPSGIGTFHASVVSAFIFLGRPPEEGLLVATAIHLLFFLAYVLPAALLYGRWRFEVKKPSNKQ